MSITTFDAASACTAQAGKGPLQAGRQAKQQESKSADAVQAKVGICCWMPLLDSTPACVPIQHKLHFQCYHKQFQQAVPRAVP